MNKAFVKEEESGEEPQRPMDPRADLPPGGRNYMTPQGARRLREERNLLAQEKRPHLLAALRALADPTEADGRTWRKALRRLEQRIEYLTARLALTDIIDPAAQACDYVRFGASVTVQPVEGPEMVYRIVGIDEADARLGRISWRSPLAQALMEGRAGDLVKVRAPAGEEELEIVAIRYTPEDGAAKP
jgi:transcription elongation factor GreB